MFQRLPEPNPGLKLANAFSVTRNFHVGSSDAWIVPASDRHLTPGAFFCSDNVKQDPSD